MRRAGHAALPVFERSTESWRGPTSAPLADTDALVAAAAAFTDADPPPAPTVGAGRGGGVGGGGGTATPTGRTVLTSVPLAGDDDDDDDDDGGGRGGAGTPIRPTAGVGQGRLPPALPTPPPIGSVRVPYTRRTHSCNVARPWRGVVRLQYGYNTV